MAQNADNPFVVCKAAAGSGKTFTLVKEYLKLAMTASGPLVRDNRDEWRRQLRMRFRGILAITFTNKATAEMKERVMTYLRQIAQHGTDRALSPMGAPLAEALSALPCYAARPLSDDELRWMADTVHSAILHNYGDLSVYTIDSFMHRVVRTFAHELDKPVNFDVMTDQEEMVNQAVERVMALIGTPGHESLSALARAYAVSLMEDDRSYRIEGALARLAAQLFREDTAPYVEALRHLTPEDYMDMQRTLAADNRRFADRVRDCGQRMMQQLSSIGVCDIDCAGGARGFYGYFRRVADGSIEPVKSTTVKAFEQGSLGSAKCSAERREALEAARPALTEIYRQLRALVGDDGSDDPRDGMPRREYNTRQLLLRNLYAMAMLGALDEQIRAYARDEEVVHLSEFNRLIGNIVRNEPAPFIYERLGNRYHHFLIDEFQDTSVQQWHNLVPLLENGVSQGWESLVVGDGKQAIYRFRQGDVRQFVDLPQVNGLPGHGNVLAHPGNHRFFPLRHNRRTARRVVEFNNRFFAWLLDQPPFAHNQLARQIYIGTPDSEGHPELYQYLPDNAAEGGHVAVDFVDPQQPDAVSEQVRSTIERLVTEQGYRQSDIMVLARHKRDLDEIGTYLRTHPSEVPLQVTSSESFFLTRSDAVCAVVAVMRLLADPTDRVAAAELLHRLSSLELIGSTHDDAFLADGTVDVAALLRSEHRGLDLRLDLLASLDLYDCCEEIIRQLHLDGIDLPYVASLLDRVATFSTHTHDGVAAFLEWYDKNASTDFTVMQRRQLSAASPEGIDAVQFMTIHAAKGLERPVVICPLYHSSSKDYDLWVNLGDGYPIGSHRLPAAYIEMSTKSQSLFDSQRDAEQSLRDIDLLNVLYVAFTRPKDQLYVVCPQPKSSEKAEANLPMLIERFVEEQHPDMGDPDMHRTPSANRPTEKSKEVALSRISFSDWTMRVQVASPAEQSLTPLQEEKLRFGTWLHDIMAHIPTAGHTARALADFFARQPLPADEQERFSTLVRQVVEHPDCRRFFLPGQQVRTECDMVDSRGIIRPDRIVFADNETWVIDFKTGAEMIDEHTRQVSRYCTAVREMGYPNVSGWVVYTEPTVHVRQVV